MATYVALAVALGMQLFGSLPYGARVVCALGAVGCVAAAVEAWRSVVIVGSAGIKVHGVFSRRSRAWDGIDGFHVAPSHRPSKLSPHVDLGAAGSRRIGDYDLPELFARKLVEDLLTELTRARSLRTTGS